MESQTTENNFIARAGHGVATTEGLDTENNFTVRMGHGVIPSETDVHAIDTVTAILGTSGHVSTADEVGTVDKVSNVTMDEVSTVGEVPNVSTPLGSPRMAFMAQVRKLLTFRVATALRIYVYPVLIPVGIIGNTLTILVILQKHNRDVSSSLYLVMLAFSDNFVLATLAYAWTINNLFSGLSLVECTIFVALLYTGTFNGMLLILSLTVDRFIAVCYPLSANIYCSHRRVRLVGVLSLVISLGVNAPHLWLTHVENNNCIAFGDGTTFANVYSWIGIILNSIVPFVTLVTLNTAILLKFRTHQRWMSSLAGAGKFTGGSERQTQMTRLLVTVSLTFLILTLPMYVRHVYYQFVDVNASPQTFATYALLYHVTQKLYFANNAVNFLLYCLGGSKFRPDLRRLLTCQTGNKNVTAQNSAAIKYGASQNSTTTKTDLSQTPTDS